MNEYALLSTLSWTWSICFLFPNKLLSGDQNSSKEADSISGSRGTALTWVKSISAFHISWPQRPSEKRLCDLSHYHQRESQHFCSENEGIKILSLLLDSNEEAHSTGRGCKLSRTPASRSKQQLMGDTDKRSPVPGSTVFSEASAAFYFLNLHKPMNFLHSSTIFEL